MRKLEKLTFKQLEDELPIMDEKMKKSITGGDTCWYTQEELDKWVTFGYWTGGYVEELGYVGPSVTVSASDPDGPWGQGYIDLTPEEKFMKAYADGLRDVVQISAAIGVAVVDFYLLLRSNFPTTGVDILGPEGSATASDEWD